MDVCYVMKLKSVNDYHKMLREHDFIKNRSIQNEGKLRISKDGCQSHPVLESACEKRNSEVHVYIDRDDF